MKLFNDDCLKVLPTIPDNSIDLIVTSPPYNMRTRVNKENTQLEKILIILVKNIKTLMML
jgi:site-specific DNA-methyltransferase (adenine-specific)